MRARGHDTRLRRTIEGGWTRWSPRGAAMRDAPFMAPHDAHSCRLLESVGAMCSQPCRFRFVCSPGQSRRSGACPAIRLRIHRFRQPRPFARTPCSVSISQGPAVRGANIANLREPGSAHRCCRWFGAATCAHLNPRYPSLIPHYFPHARISGRFSCATHANP